jgi:hypothetical protein
MPKRHERDGDASIPSDGAPTQGRRVILHFWKTLYRDIPASAEAGGRLKNPERIYDPVYS